MKRRKKIMWELIEAVALARVLNKNLRPLRWGIGIAGSVLSKGYSDKDLDLIVFPYDTCCATKEVLYMALKAEGLTCRYNVDKVQAAWRKQGSNDSKHVEVWEDQAGKRIDLFILA